MSYGPNRWGLRPASRAIQAGGIQMFFRHPKLAGHVFSGTNIDEIDVSKACKLNDTFLDAAPAMDSAIQEVLVDGSVITITNKLLAGVMTLQVLEQGGFVGLGDFISALQLVQSSGDTVGGTFTTVRNFSGKQRVRVYYGVFAKNVPHEKIAGNAVVPYPIQLFYAGWFEGVGATDAAVTEYIWAVGNDRGTIGTYSQFTENEEGADERGQVPASVNIHSNAIGTVDNFSEFSGVPGALATTDLNGTKLNYANADVTVDSSPSTVKTKK